MEQKEGRPDAAVMQGIGPSSHDQLDADHSLAAMATLADLPVHGFLPAFRKAFGTTPWDYLVRARLEEGRRLLVETDQPVTGIALATGFSTPSHFSTAFRKRFGVSPLTYRRNATGKPTP